MKEMQEMKRRREKDMKMKRGREEEKKGQDESVAYRYSVADYFAEVAGGHMTHLNNSQPPAT